MRKRRNYQVDYSRYTFNADDDWGDYDNGKYREGSNDDEGYRRHNYWCDDGKRHNMLEHTAKWEFFNGRIPEGMEIDHVLPIRIGGTNNLCNLRICTHKENINNAETIKLFSKIKTGVKNPNKGKTIEEIYGEERAKEIIKKIRNSTKGENAYWYGKKIPKEAAQKISEKNSKTVYQYDKENVLIKSYKSVVSASIENNIDSTGISKCCRGEIKTYKNYKWSYEPLN